MCNCVYVVKYFFQLFVYNIVTQAAVDSIW